MRKTGAIKVILLTILTFGIYGAYYIIKSLYLNNGDKNNDTDRTLAALWFMNNNNFH